MSEKTQDQIKSEARLERLLSRLELIADQIGRAQEAGQEDRVEGLLKEQDYRQKEAAFLEAKLSYFSE